MQTWWREFARRPASSTFLLLSLAMSLASGVAAWSLHAVVQWRPLPFRDAESLVKLAVYTAGQNGRWWSGPEVQTLAGVPDAPFRSIAAYTVADYNVLSEPGRPPEALLGMLVSPGFFATLGVQPALGRVTAAEDFGDAGTRVVLLSHELWHRRYGRDPSVVGRTIRLTGPTYLGNTDGDYRVVGVLPADAWLFWKRMDLVLPLRATNGALADPDRYPVEHVVARAVNTRAAAASGLGPALFSRLPVSRERATSVAVEQLATALFRDLQPQLRLLLTIAALVLALAAANLVITLSAGMAARRQEVAVRLALGASRSRIARDHATAAAWTLAVGGAISVALATWFLDGAVAFIPDGWLARIPGQSSAIGPDATAVTMLAAVSALIVGAVSLGAVVSAARTDIAGLLSSLRPVDIPRPQRWRSAVVVAEVAICAATVSVAATLVLQLWRAHDAELGIKPDGLTALWINASPTTYADDGNRAAYFDRLVDAAGSVPGVEMACAISLPFTFEWETTPVRTAIDGTIATVVALDRRATPSYAETTGGTIIDGRWLTPADSAGAERVAVASESLARALSPRERLVGREVEIGEDDARAVVRIVGVVSDTKPAPHKPASRTLYRPIAQRPPPSVYLMVRHAPGVERARAIEAAVWRVDPDQPVDGPWSMRSWVDGKTAHLSLLARLTAWLAAIGVILAATGLFGLTMFWVEASRRELGIRRAVGASHQAIAAWFGARWLRVMITGLATGVALQAGVMRVAAAAVEGLRPANGVELALAAAVVVIVAAVAAAAALRRALQVDPQALVRP